MEHAQQMPYSSLDRRTFLRKSFKACMALYSASFFGWPTHGHAQGTSTALPDLVAVKNGAPDIMFDQAIAAMGGIETYVKPGQIVVVKPNIGWSREPETGANTNPLLVKRIVEHCMHARAKKVYVFDHAAEKRAAKDAYQKSGIGSVAKAAGAIMVPGHDKKYYESATIPDGKKLKKAHVHELVLESDVFINIPVLKHHKSAHLTIAMKNLMGVVWNRMWYHLRGLHDCIADFCLYRKPDLNIVDAYLVTMANGPQRARPEDLVLKKSLLLSPDIVAVDAAAAKIFGVEPTDVRYIQLAHDKGIGNMNLNELHIKKIVL